MTFGNLFEHVPHIRGLSLNELLGRANGVHVAQFFEATDDEGLKQYECHFLGQPALVKFQFGPDNNHRATGIIHTLAEQVLAEPTALALEHIGKTFQCAIACAGHGTTVATVVKQGVDGLLQHPFLIADDDLGGFQLREIFQAIVAVDDAPI